MNGVLLIIDNCSQMNNMLAEFEPYKDRIPEFIIKLYHILEQKEYSEYLSWHGDNQIYIKNVKKLEERVLPNYFRHKHISSFIRQLNMYRFNKVCKPTKERNAMYFKNDLFLRGNIKLLTKIKRNHKNSKDQTNHEESPESADNISLNHHLEANTALTEYKAYVKNTIGEVLKSIRRLESAHPEARNELLEAVFKCKELLEIPSQSINSSLLSLDDCLQNKNMMSTMKLLPIEPILFSSQCSFFHIN